MTPDRQFVIDTCRAELELLTDGLPAMLRLEVNYQRLLRILEAGEPEGETRELAEQLLAQICRDRTLAAMCWPTEEQMGPGPGDA